MFISLTPVKWISDNRTQLLVNMDRVSYLVPIEEGSKLRMVDQTGTDNTLDVRETPDEIVEIMKPGEDPKHASHRHKS